jgi:hypothetical protein
MLNLLVHHVTSRLSKVNTIEEGLSRVVTAVTDETRFRHSSKIKKEKSLTASRYISDKRRVASDSKQHISSGSLILGKAELRDARGGVKSLRKRVANTRKNV